MAGWHHRLDGHEFQSTPGVGGGQGGLVCCDSWGHKESDTTERLNLSELIVAAMTHTVSGISSSTQAASPKVKLGKTYKLLQNSKSCTIFFLFKKKK